MAMSQETAALIFVHGIGGHCDTDRWLAPLESRLAERGYGRPTSDVLRPIDTDWLDLIKYPTEGSKPRATWTSPPDEVWEAQRTQFLLDREEAARNLSPLADGPKWSVLNGLGSRVAPSAVRNLNMLRSVSKYRTDPQVRHAVWRSVLEAFPTDGSAIVVAHSLGSVIAADIISRLPSNLTVELLITVGSPLASNLFGVDAASLNDRFPYDRVKTWLNIYDPMDPVTMGQGIGGRFPAALDLPVNVDWDHDIDAYMAHPVIAEAVGQSLYDPRTARAPTMNPPAHTIGREWYPLLLTFGYSGLVTRSYLGRDWKRRARLDRARRQLADQTLAVIDVGLTAFAQQAEAAEPSSTPRDSGFQVRDTPLRISDLLDRPAHLVEGAWPDAELIPLLVGLRMAPLVPPYDIEISDQRLRAALIELVSQIRMKNNQLPEDPHAIVSAVVSAVDEARRVVHEGASWKVAALVGAGVVILAATGVGLAVAVPAGLAGGAAMVGGLAAFGPGGMAGGIATIAALSGLGGGLAGSGLVLGAGSPSRLEISATDLAEAVTTVLAGSLDQLRGAVAGMISLVGAESRLNVNSASVEVLRFLDVAHARALREHELHDAIAPDRPGTKSWEARVDLLDRALKWLIANGPSQELPVAGWKTMREELGG